MPFAIEPIQIHLTRLPKKIFPVSDFLTPVTQFIHLRKVKILLHLSAKTEKNNNFCRIFRGLSGLAIFFQLTNDFIITTFDQNKSSTYLH